MFIPSWYQPPIVQLVSEPATKLPYNKLQYPTYVKDTYLDVHIRVFKNAIKANGETMEVDIINLFGFTFRDNISEWGENYVQDHPNCTFEEFGTNILQVFRTIKNDHEFYMHCETYNNKPLNMLRFTMNAC
jgi:hypothetical protein